MRRDTRAARLRLVAVAAIGGLALVACGGDDGAADAGTPAAEGSVQFESPSDGDTVSSPVTIAMAAEGVTIEPAAEGVNEGAGHLHVMVDTDCVTPGEVIPGDDSHRHFGDGSTTAELELEPGEHTLCLQLADGEHVASDLTDEITITVE